MGDGVFNIAKGRGIEYYNRVKANDPTNAAFIVVLAFGAATDATIRDYDDLGALIGDAGITEATFTSYARKTLTDTELAALPAPDDTNDRYEIDLPDQTWSPAGGATNNTLTRMFICYDSDTAAGTDANIIPVTFHDFAVTTDGSDLTAQFDALGFLRAA
jgi:hypothetical protein